MPNDDVSPKSPSIRNYQAIDAAAEDINDHVQIEVQERGSIDRPRYVLYVHVNGMTICRVLCHTLTAKMPTGMTIRRTRT